MSFVGTFGSFTTARLGIYAAQKGLQVTGNNISNINTIGYTRQALDQVSLRTGGADRYQSQFDCRVGTGVLCVGVSQIRDPYLDIRYRNEMSSVGAADAKLGGLENLAAILDEVAKGEEQNGVIEAQLSDLFKTLENLSVNTGLKEYDTQVRASASALVSLFNSYAKRLEDVQSNAEKSFAQDIKSVNRILNNIRDLNASIRKSEIHGDSALELRDERNLLIDELSQYMKIDAIYTMEDLGGGQQVEKLTIKLGNANPDPNEKGDTSILVDGNYATQLGITQVPKPNPDHDPNDPASPPYLDINGNPTDDETKAAMIDDPYYRLTLDALKDHKNRLQILSQDITRNPFTPPDAAWTPPDPPAFTDNGDGTTTLVTYEQDKDGNWTEVTTTKTASTPVDLDDNDLYGALQSAREMLTEAGEFASQEAIGIDENAAIKRGIPYYRKSLDLLANKIANEFNKANQGFMVNEDGQYIGADGKPLTYDFQDGKGPIELSKDMTLTDTQATALLAGYTTDADGNYLDKNGNPILVDGKPLNQTDIQPGVPLTAAQSSALLENYVEHNGGVPAENQGNLFSNRGDLDDAKGITAANISISAGWASGDVRVVASFTQPSNMEVGTTDNSNILHMLSMMQDKSVVYNPKDLDPDANSDTLFTGTFHEMLGNIGAVLGNEQRSTTILLNTYSAAAVQLDTSRSSIAGVDLNDEAANLMQYQKSYAAACRLMTTLDEAIDKLVNGTGIVGR